MKYKQILMAAACLLMCLPLFSQQVNNTDTVAFVGYTALKETFLHPKDAVQTSVYWYWISDCISKEGVTKDLESMKKAGINRAFIGNIEMGDAGPHRVEFMSDEWWDIMHTALKKATELNIDIGIFNSPGWSQSGGPWIKPSQAMRYLAATDTTVTGGKKISLHLKAPSDDFQPVNTIAFPAPKDYFTSIASLHPVITASTAINNAAALIDDDTTNEVTIPADSTITFNISTTKAFTARSITVYPAHRFILAKVLVQANVNGSFTTIKEFTINRSNSALNVGFDPYGQVDVSLPATTAKSFRLVINSLAPNADCGIQDIHISSSPKVESYIEKTLAKMCQTPFPLWGQYLWPEQPAVQDTQLAIAPSSVTDITSYVSADGKLEWTAPAGNWIIMRCGMVPTGVVNSPAPPNGTGLEVDKINKAYLAAHFDGYLGKILQRIPAEDRKAFKVVVEDSYETGGQNWTDSLADKFKAIYHYNPVPYLPVMYGNVVGSEDMSDRFLWDLRRFVADKVSFEYVGGLRDISHQHGLTTWLENYGHWGFPGEFLQYGGQSDEIGGEFWSEGDLGNIENRAASSSAHIYGKTKVSAESFTCGGAAFSRYPATMKQRGDRFFTEGINNTLLHVYIDQPYADTVPGVNAGFGNEFNRNNTWFKDINLFTDYLKRCNLMLQQGRYVADVAYFIGEDAPKMTGVCDPALPKGYSFDYINADVLKQRITVKDGMLVLPDGITYKMLVLPQLKTMRPELLKKISELVYDGAVVYGPAPDKSPSLENFPQADEQVKTIAAKLWGNIDGKTTTSHKYGMGMMINGMALQTALDMIDARPDCIITGADSVLFIHRKLQQDDIYFLSNQTGNKISFHASFKVTGKQPELWDAVSGTSRLLPQYSSSQNNTDIPLTLAENGSAFIVFTTKNNNRKHADSALNFPVPAILTSIQTPWQVQFDTARWGPVNPVTFNTLTDWTSNTNDSIKYYSGTAAYTNSFTLKTLNNKAHIILSLGKVNAMATVKINGKDVGGVWTAPYELDITNAVQTGINTLEVAVVNTWVNRLISDLNLPEKERKTWVTVNPYNKDSALQTSGLLGPVSIQAVVY